MSTPYEPATQPAARCSRYADAERAVDYLSDHDSYDVLAGTHVADRARELLTAGGAPGVGQAGDVR